MEDTDLLLARQLQAEEDIDYREQQKLYRGLPIGLDDGEARKRSFLQQLRSGVAHVLQYEDDFLRANALSHVPGKVLELLAQGAIRHDDAVKELLAWFKREFFTWVDKPECRNCGGSQCQLKETSPPYTPEELRGRAGAVEVYSCPSCGCKIRFPRFNDPAKLLETRKGRCGEWANAFTLLCRAAGLEARWCRDWTDHVWTEVYSPLQRRWIHLDPCENAFDNPHLYEAGWGKKLSYVIAFSRCGAADVSPRYSTDRDATAERQANVAPIEWVRHACRGLTYHVRDGWAVPRAVLWEQRDCEEAAELAVGPSAAAPAPETRGRQTGSVEWRRARGELGKHPAGTNPQDDSRDGSSASEPDGQPQEPAETAATATATARAGCTTPAVPAARIESGASEAASQLAEAARDEAASAPKAPAETPPPDASPAVQARQGGTERDEFTRRMQAAFSELMSSGRYAANEAAILALRRVRDGVPR